MSHYPYLFSLIVVTLSTTAGAAVLYFAGVPVLLALGLGLNLSCFLMMGIDKIQARHNNMRVPEKFVYLLGMGGGAPGVLLGMLFFRHKTRKAYFVFIIASFMLIQLAALSCLTTP